MARRRSSQAASLRSLSIPCAPIFAPSTPLRTPRGLLESRSAGAAPPEVITVSEHRIACEGVGGALGHPRVWLEMGAKGFVECGYCDRRYVLSGEAHDEIEEIDPADYVGAGGH